MHYNHAMNKIHLFLDDCRPTPEGFTHSVKTAQEAIALLKTGDVELISLDHDLGDEAVVGSGYQVAKWIEECAYYNQISRLLWTIHSANPVGRKNMEAALRNAWRQWDKHAEALQIEQGP